MTPTIASAHKGGSCQPWYVVPLAVGMAVSLGGQTAWMPTPVYTTELTDSGIPGQLANPTYLVPNESWDLHVKIKSMERVAEDLLQNGKNLDPAISSLVDEKFWDLL
ncbi:MAG: hypothetical protein GX442_00430 [Candidatus Riflebacteria bacterium]|nr:hypothetical protein [Candidatus Riflebacteria bacterium]